MHVYSFLLRNLAWIKQIESLLKEAVPGLGLKAERHQVKAEIYKLVLKGPSYHTKIPRKPTRYLVNTPVEE
jgi:hypothetical protein